MKRSGICLLLAFVASSCGIFDGELPTASPPLVDFEEPLALFEEPADEAERQELPLGVFTGIEVEDVADSLDSMEAGDSSVQVLRVIENSPGDVAGVLPGDYVLTQMRAESTDALPIHWASQWRDSEIKGVEGERWILSLDRAGKEIQVTLKPTRRVRHPERLKAERYREESRVGVVLRTATEVEAVRAGLPPGGGAVIVGLSKRSPWRAAGLTFEDLLTEVNQTPVHHPEVVLDAIRKADSGTSIDLTVLRRGEQLSLMAPVSERESDLQSFNIPLLFSHEKDRGRSSTSFLLGLFGHESTEAASETTLLWLIKLRSGDADRLKEIPAQ